jgi:hypothetical protein
MSNPFDDLDADEDDSATDSAVSDAESATEDESVKSNSQSRAAVVTDQESTESSSPSESGPAFEYSAVRQRPLYARGETWDEFEKTFRTTIAPSLAEADVVDEETREIHDAVLRLAAAKPEQVAELVLEARREQD